MKKVLKVSLLIMLVATLVISMIACSGLKKVSDKINLPTDENGNPLTSDTMHELPQKINFSACQLNSDPKNGAYDGGYKLYLTATVTPEDAPNRDVTWSVAWSNPDSDFASGKTVTDYIVVQQNPYHSTTREAEVVCVQAFGSDTIVITVKTDDGGFEASCICSWVGTPTELTIATGIDYSANGDHTESYNLGSNRTYDFDLNLNNPLGAVDSSYSTNYSVELIAYGNIYVRDQKATYPSAGSSNPITYEWLTDEKVVALNDIVSNFVTTSIVNGKLHVETNDIVENYYFDQYQLYYEHTYTDKFARFGNLPGSVRPYFSIKVTEQNSGKYDTIQFLINSSVEDVSLNNSSLEF